MVIQNYRQKTHNNKKLAFIWQERMQIVLEPQTLSKSAKSEISSHNERIMCWYSVSLAGTQAPLPSMTHARKAIQSKSF